MASNSITAVDPKSIHDALKEAVVDGLLNVVTARLSGQGNYGKVIFGAKPRVALTTAFLLPKPLRERQGDEEASPIHISAHGLDFQIVTAHGDDEIVVKPTAVAYVRILPKAEDLKHGGPCEPSFPVEGAVKRALKQRIRDLTREELAKLGEKGRKHPDWPGINQALRKKAHEEIGLPFDDGTVEDREPDEGMNPLAGSLETTPDETPEDAPEGAQDPTVGVTVSGGVDLPDHLVQGIAPPPKWLRIDLTLPEFTFRPSNFADAAEKASVSLNREIEKQLKIWAESNDPEWGGKMWGFRRARKIKPLDVKNWDKYLGEIRASKLEPVRPQILLRWVVEIYKDPTDASRQSVHVALENWSDDPGSAHFKESEEAIFQVSVQVAMPESIHRPLVLDRVEPSYRYNEYLNYPALGFNAGSLADKRDGRIIISTTWTPRYIQPRVVPTELSSKGVVSRIRDLAKDDCINGLKPILTTYEEWLAKVKSHRYDKGIDPSRIDLIAKEKAKLEDDIKHWAMELNAIRIGIAILEESRGHWSGKGVQKDPRGIPFEAWVSMNEAMARVAEKKGYTDWRLFQVTFILANLPAFVTRMEEFHGHYTPEVAAYSNSVTLLYFATGGGKSEAFLGLLVYVLFFDRLRGKERGVSAMLRYPLRLLTLQQAQRTAKTLAQAELVRREREHPGEPLSLGFWVGSSNTPNWLRDEDLKTSVPLISAQAAEAETDLSQHQQSYKLAVERWRKLPECPFCFSPKGTALRRFDSRGGLLGHLCLNDECGWNVYSGKNTPLPFYIVDEDIYDLAPSVLLGTIDKLSAIGQAQGTIRKFFGMFGFAPWLESAVNRLHIPSEKEFKKGPGAQYTPLYPTYTNGEKRFFDPFPSLMIQDEAHLLDESLGTFAGLFETALDAALDELAPLLGAVIATEPSSEVRRRVKVIAASATVNEPDRQMRNLYQRGETVQFPYPGPELYRSFYAEPKAPDATPEDAERRAIPAEQVELSSHWGRVYQSLLTNGRTHTVTMVTALANYHAAITYFYERFKSGIVAEQDAARNELIAHLSPDPLQAQFKRLLSNADPQVLLTLIDLHRIALTYVTNKKGGDQIIDAERSEFEKLHRRDGYPNHRLNSDLITGAVDAGQIQDVVRQAESRPKPGKEFFDLNDTLRSIIATAAVSHGVDVEELNAMFFAGMPSDIAEYIQASSRVGRTHVGFCILVPTPQRARDRYIVEVHDIFHRFLERMILPAAIDRWAEKALVRVIPSFFQTYVCGVRAIKELANAVESDKSTQAEYRMAGDIRDAINANPGVVKEIIAKFIRNAYGLKPGFAPDGEPYYVSVITKQMDAIHGNLDEPRFLGSDLKHFFATRDISLRPMTSLRDVDEPGYIIPWTREARDTAKLQDGSLARVMRFIRSGSGADIDDSGNEE